MSIQRLAKGTLEGTLPKERPLPDFVDDMGDGSFQVEPPSAMRLRKQRERMAIEADERAKRLARPVKSEATANVCDNHVERVVLDGHTLRFGYGIERQVLKGKLPMSTLRACERFREDWEAAHAGGASAVVDPTRVRVDNSPRLDPILLAADAPARLIKALDAVGGPGSATARVLVRCVAEGKTIKDAAGEIAATGLGREREFARGLLVAGVVILTRHYGY